MYVYEPITLTRNGRTITVVPVYRDAKDSPLLHSAASLAAESADHRAAREAAGYATTMPLPRAFPMGSRHD